MLLEKLIEKVKKVSVKNYDLNIDINDIAYDSRKVKAGNIFVCIKGFKSDGHKYILQALENGAKALVVQEEVKENIDVPIIKVDNTRLALAKISAAFYRNPTRKFKLIGITGTNGKTTTTYLIKNILETNGFKVGLIGTNQNMIGDKVIPTERTTPESFELQKLFNEMAEEKVDVAIMEVSSHSLELNRVDECDFDIGVFTNITQDHLDFHITMENYLKAKTKLFKKCKMGIVNIDDSSSKYILENGLCKFITFGIDNEGDLKTNNPIITAKGVQFKMTYLQDECSFELGIPGKFSVYNALGSIGACIALGIDMDTIRRGLKSAKGVPGRAQIVKIGFDYTIIIDYAHTPDGIYNILSTVKGFAKGRVVTLFGCGGDRDAKKRPLMGEMAGNFSDFCIVTSDNPRTEDPNVIIKDILPGIDRTNCEYIIIENRKKAIEYAMVNGKKDDVIVLAGKGHETYQEIDGIKNHFNEEEIIIEIAERIKKILEKN